MILCFLRSIYYKESGGFSSSLDLDHHDTVARTSVGFGHPAHVLPDVLCGHLSAHGACCRLDVLNHGVHLELARPVAHSACDGLHAPVLEAKGTTFRLEPLNKHMRRQATYEEVEAQETVSRPELLILKEELVVHDCQTVDDVEVVLRSSGRMRISVSGLSSVVRNDSSITVLTSRARMSKSSINLLSLCLILLLTSSLSSSQVTTPSSSRSSCSFKPVIPLVCHSSNPSADAEAAAPLVLADEDAEPDRPEDEPRWKDGESSKAVSVA